MTYSKIASYIIATAAIKYVGGRMIEREAEKMLAKQAEEQRRKEMAEAKEREIWRKSYIPCTKLTW